MRQLDEGMDVPGIAKVAFTSEDPPVHHLA
jgi:hypothetical protein